MFTFKTEVNLVTLQRDAICKMFQLDGIEDTWKVLIIDAFCTDMIQPVIDVATIRKEGVTLIIVKHILSS